jgi:hypothetical protein
MARRGRGFLPEGVVYRSPAAIKRRATCAKLPGIAKVKNRQFPAARDHFPCNFVHARTAFFIAALSRAGTTGPNNQPN